MCLIDSQDIFKLTKYKGSNLCYINSANRFVCCRILLFCHVMAQYVFMKHVENNVQLFICDVSLVQYRTKNSLWVE